MPYSFELALESRRLEESHCLTQQVKSTRKQIQTRQRRNFLLHQRLQGGIGSYKLFTEGLQMESERSSVRDAV